MAALALIVAVLVKTLQIYTLVLIVRVLLSWFPNLDWGNPILSAISSITDPFLNVFRGLIPPIGGLDISAIVAFLALQLVQTLLEQSVVLLAASVTPGL
jgi:YggT family protein